MELVLKTSGQQCLVGSNPTPSARPDDTRPGDTRGTRETKRCDPPRVARRSHLRVARHGRLTRHSAWKTAAKAVASVVAVALVSGSAVAAYAAFDLASSLKPTVALGNEAVLEGVPDVGAIEGGVNLLVIGSDSREGQGDGFGDPDEETGGAQRRHDAHAHRAKTTRTPRSSASRATCSSTCRPAPTPPIRRGDPLWEQYGVKMNSVLAVRRHGVRREDRRAAHRV